MNRPGLLTRFLAPGRSAGPRLRSTWRPTVDALEGRLLLASPENVTVADMAFADNLQVVVVGAAKVDDSGDTDFAFNRLGQFNSVPDPTFAGGNGVEVAFDLGGDHGDGAQKVVIQPDGKIVAAGYADIDGGQQVLALVRLNKDGTLDTTFDHDGLQAIPVPGGLSGLKLMDLSIGADGSILLAGQARNASGGDILVAARVKTDGSPDTTYHTDGVMTFSLDRDGLQDVTLNTQFRTPDGNRLLLGSGRVTSSGNRAFAVVLVKPDYSPINTFGDHAVRAIAFGASPAAEAFGADFQSDGSIVVAGSAKNAATGVRDFAVTRLSSTGTIDTNFGDSGRRLIDFVTPDGAPGGAGVPVDVVARNVVVFSNGAIQVSGDALGLGKFANQATTHLDSTGAIDTTFGDNGRRLDLATGGGGVVIPYFPIVIVKSRGGSGGGGSGGPGGGSGGTGSNSPPPSPPSLASASAQHRRRTRKVIAINLDFGARLDASSAGNPSRYYVVRLVRTRKRKAPSARLVGVGPVSYDDATHRVTIRLLRPSVGPLRVTIAPGLAGANGGSTTSPLTSVVV